MINQDEYKAHKQNEDDNNIVADQPKIKRNSKAIAAVMIFGFFSVGAYIAYKNRKKIINIIENNKKNETVEIVEEQDV